MKKLKGMLFAIVIFVISMGITVYADDITMEYGNNAVIFSADVGENQVMYSAIYDDGKLQSVYTSDTDNTSVTVPLDIELSKEYTVKAFCWDKTANEPLTSASEMLMKQVSSSDFNADGSDAENGVLDFSDDGVFNVAEDTLCYINGVNETISVCKEYIANNPQLPVKFLYDNTGNVDAVLIFDCGTAVVDNVAESGERYTIYFSNYSADLNSARLVIDADISCNFTLDGQNIDVTELETGDVLSISYDSAVDFVDSAFYDVKVSRDSFEGECVGVAASGDRYCFGSQWYDIAPNMYVYIETEAEYMVYLDCFGRIAYAIEIETPKNCGILTDISQKWDGSYIASVVTAKGNEEKYVIADEDVADYTAILTTADSTLESYPEQVIEYEIDSNTNMITIKSMVADEYGNDVAVALSGNYDTGEYKAATSRIGSIRISDEAAIIDISNTDDGGKCRAISLDMLTDGCEYSMVGYDKSSTDASYRFVIITAGINNGFDSESQLAIFKSQSVKNDGGISRTAFDVVINGEEQTIFLADSFANTYTDLAEGDPILFATDYDGYMTELQPVFATLGMLNNATCQSFNNAVLNNNGKGILFADEDYDNDGFADFFEQLLSDSNENCQIVFAPVIDKSTNGTPAITIGSVTDNRYVNLYDGLEIITSDAKVYTYDFAAESKLLLDERITATPKTNSAVIDYYGQEYLDLSHDDLKGEVVYAVVRVIGDEAQEIYQIISSE